MAWCKSEGMMDDGQRIQAESYNLLLPELTGDFGELNILNL
jgi:hypothetical protein